MLYVCVNVYCALQTTNIKAVGYTAFVGGMLFWIGAYLAVLQAMNTERFIRPHAGYEAASTDSTATASTTSDNDIVHIKPHTPRHTVLKRLASTRKSSSSSSSSSRVGDEQQQQQQQQHGDIEAQQQQQQQQKHNGHHAAAAPSSSTATTAGIDKNGTDSANGQPNGHTTEGYSGQPPVEAWTWALFPHRGSVRWHEAGYVAAIVQFVGATSFSFSVIAGFPGVIAGEYDAKYKVSYYISVIINI
jgi:hypothetical protein